jgi:hypothetical protein
MRTAQSAIVAAIRANRTVVNATTVNKTSTVVQRWGPPGGSRDKPGPI